MKPSAASIASSLPVPGDRMMARISVPGSDNEPVVAASFDVSADYFTTLGTSILSGRSFTTAEQHDPPAAGSGVVLGAAVALALFGDTDGVGRVVGFALVTALATGIPAHAATRVDPIETLRQE